jgi:hypothetical protein
VGLGSSQGDLDSVVNRLLWACRILTTHSLFTLPFFILRVMRKCPLGAIYYIGQEDLEKHYFVIFGNSE